MTDRELTRRARSRARKERRRRRRQRNAAIAVLAFVVLGVFTTTAFDVFEPTRKVGPPLPIRTRVQYPALSMRDDSLMLYSSNILLKNTLPELVDLDKLFPSRSRGRNEDPQPQEPDRPDVLVLEDFQAAPAKRAFLESIDEATSDPSEEIQPQAALDEVDSLPPTYELGGAPAYFDLPPPAVPEPGSGLLVAIGLLTLGLRGRTRRLARAGRRQSVAPGHLRRSLLQLLLAALLLLPSGCAHVEKHLKIRRDDASGSGRSAELIAQYREEAEAGFALGQYNLGLSYFYGEGVTQDKAKGVEWYRKAAEQSLPQAQYNLASALMQGEGVERDPLEAVKWFTAAAELGDADSQFNLGLLHLNGEHVEKDLAAAARWFTWAAEQDHVKARANLGVAYLKGRGVDQNSAVAADWFEKAADDGHAQAQFNLAQAYEYGIGVQRRPGRAAHWYVEAADQGIPGAQFRAGLAYRGGRGVKQDFVAAYKWFALAADAGYFKASEPMQELEKSLSTDDLAKARKAVQNWNQMHFSAEEG